MFGSTSAVPLKVQAAPLDSSRLSLRDIFRWARLKTFPDQILRACENPAFLVFSCFGLCLLGLLVFMHKFTISLPFADEYGLVAMACRKIPLSFEWLWAPANEHRAPLLRLYLVVIGDLLHWDFRTMHKVNLAFLAIGVFALLQAVRKMRGRYAVEDCFLPLVLLSPSLSDTIIYYVYAYTPALGLLCMAFALVISGAVYRSKWACSLYFLLAFAILLGAGPAGQLWFAGLMCVVPFLWVHPEFKRWRYLALLAAVAGLIITALIINAIPHLSYHEQYHSTSWKMTAKLAFCHTLAWMGYYPLTDLQPYLGVAVLIPYFYVTVRTSGALFEMVRQRSLQVHNGPTWVPVAAVGMTTLLLCVVVAHNRNSIFLWTPRYHCMLAPIAVVLYLLLVRFNAPRIMPKLLTALILICSGWTWHAMLDKLPVRSPIVAVLRNGDYPLCYLVPQSSWNVGAPADVVWQNMLIEWWRDLREQRLSVFHKMSPSNPAIAMHPIKGSIDPSIEGKSEEAAVQKLALKLRPGAKEGRMTFPIHLPVDQEYQVWIRCRSEADGEFITVRIDDGAPVDVRLLHYPTYAPVKLRDNLALGAGIHTLELTLRGATTRIDFVEVVKKP